MFEGRVPDFTGSAAVLGARLPLTRSFAFSRMPRGWSHRLQPRGLASFTPSCAWKVPACLRGRVTHCSAGPSDIPLSGGSALGTYLSPTGGRPGFFQVGALGKLQCVHRGWPFCTTVGPIWSVAHRQQCQHLVWQKPFSALECYLVVLHASARARNKPSTCDRDPAQQAPCAELPCSPARPFFTSALVGVTCSPASSLLAVRRLVLVPRARGAPGCCSLTLSSGGTLRTSVHPITALLVSWGSRTQAAPIPRWVPHLCVRLMEPPCQGRPGETGSSSC